MKKIRLNAEELVVMSFAPEALRGRWRGTVLANRVDLPGVVHQRNTEPDWCYENTEPVWCMENTEPGWCMENTEPDWCMENTEPDWCRLPTEQIGCHQGPIGLG